jgi:hypothetical protein
MIAQNTNRTPEAGLKELWLEVPITTTAGAVGTAVRRQGFLLTAPVVRNSAGNYDLFLDQRWQACLFAEVLLADGTVAATDGFALRSVTRTNVNAATPKVTIQLVQASGAAADPFAGSGAGTLLVHLTMKDSTV